MTRAHNFGVFLTRLTHVPCVATVHSHKIHPHRQFANHAIAVSSVTSRYHQTHNLIPRKKMDMVYNFVDTARLEVPATIHWQVIEERKLAPYHLPVGVISNFLPRKGQLYLVRALADVLSAAPNTMVVFVGHIRKHEYYERVRNDAVRPGAMNQILWRRYRSEIPWLLSALDGYALPSREEIFPVALLPAMAAGSACVAS
jgi:glycosyltransferase involved in cell wall biosynthesis